MPGKSAVLAVLDGEHFEPGLWDLARWRTALRQLYAQRGYAPLWMRENRLTPPGAALLAELRHAARRGLRPEDYAAGPLSRRAARLAAAPQPAADRAAELDVAISVAAARFVSDLHRGRVSPKKLGDVLDVRRPPLDVPATLESLAGAQQLGARLDALAPDFIHYRLLKAALARYRSLAGDPTLTQLPRPRRSVRAGAGYAGAPALRRLLAAVGDLRGTDPQPGELADRLDQALVAALERFQARHGLAVDGVLGPETYRALTTPLAHRVRQIDLSLERWRWLPPELDTPPIFVNIPQFRLFAFYTTRDEEHAMLPMDVIVGKSFRRFETPVFTADMRYLVLNPYWDVPYSIVRRELLPKIRRNPGWLEKNGYQIVRGSSDEDAAVVAPSEASLAALQAGALRLRQVPGPENALGFVKFIFPNRHNVYLHSTPERQLFSRTRRAFSHGCIRVAEPMALIGYVLRADPSWPMRRVRAVISSGRTLRIMLPRPIRVYIVYATALATEDGRTLFFRDIYRQDARLTALLDARTARALTAARPPRSRAE